jgi:hypothetical protein
MSRLRSSLSFIIIAVDDVQWGKKWRITVTVLGNVPMIKALLDLHFWLLFEELLCYLEISFFIQFCALCCVVSISRRTATYPVRPLSHGRLRRPPGDYEKQAAVTSERLSLSSLKMNAQCSARTGRLLLYGPQGNLKKI